MKKLRLTYVVGDLFPFGGLQRHVFDLIEYFSELESVDCTLVCSEKYFSVNTKEFLASKFPNLNVVILKTVGWNSVRLFSLSDLFRVIKIFRKSDIVHLHDLRFLLFSLIFSGTAALRIISSHGFFFHNGFSKLKIKIFKFYSFLINRYLRYCVCVSRSDFNIANSFGLENALLRENWTKKKYKHFHCKDEKMLYFGRLEDSKGVRQICTEAFVRTLADMGIELVVVGTGSLSKFVEWKSKKLGFTYLGFVSDGELDNLMSCCRYAVFPSAREGFGLTVLEALSSNMQCFLRLDSNYPEIFPSGPFNFFTFDNLDDFTFKLNMRYSDQEIEVFLSDFSFESSVEWFFNLYGLTRR